MAQFHFHSQVIGKSKGRSAVAAAAYRSGTKLIEYVLDKKTGVIAEKIWDYSNKKGVVYSCILAPENAPEWIYDREVLWNRVTHQETRKDAQYCREFDVALPIELTPEQNRELLKEMVQKCFVDCGMVADFNMHLDNLKNPHAHIMVTMRDLVKLDNGEVCFGLKNREWNRNSFLVQARAEVACIINHHLERFGHEARVSHLSHKDRGIGLVPTVHVGVAGKRLTYAERSKLNDEIIQENARRIRLDPSLVIDRLSIDKPVFSSTDIELELHKTLMINVDPEGSGVKSVQELYSQEELLSMYGTVIASRKLVMVNGCDLRERTLFARADRMELENKLENIMEELASQKTHSLNIKEEELERYFVAGKEPIPEQKRAVMHILNGSNLSVLEGLPGSGKSTVMRTVVQPYIEAGYTIIGTAITNKASEELAAKLGIRVVNITRLRGELQKKRGYEANLNLGYSFYKEKEYSDFKGVLPEKTLVIIDEAGFVDSPNMCYLLDEVNKSGCKAVVLGDSNQNPAIGAKGGLSRAGNIAGRASLQEINRHKNPDEYVRDLHIKATQALGRYDIPTALEIYEELGMIRVFDNEAEKRAALVHDVTSQIIAYSKDDLATFSSTNDMEALKLVAVGAYTNEEVGLYNSMIRKNLQEAGIVKGKGRLYRSGGGKMVELALGDQIIFKSNKGEFAGYGGVDNNEIGVISRLGEVDGQGYGEFEVRVRCGHEWRQVKIRTDDERYPVKFRHGYALTNSALQGVEVAKKFFSGDRYSGYEAFNVGVTRHVEDCRVYVAADTLEDEVFRTKSLDVEKVREEFEAIAYQWKKSWSEEEEKEVFEQIPVPLWKVGLKLLVSKRANLNFARDYDYQGYHQKVKGEKIKPVYEQMFAGSVPESANHQQLVSDIVILQEKQEEVEAKLKVKLEESRLYLEAKRDKLEGKIDRYFDFVTEDVILDSRAIVASVKRYKEELRESLASDNPGTVPDKKLIFKSLSTRLGILKGGQITEEGHKRLRFADLDILDQNLLLRSFLSKAELQDIKKQVRSIEKLEADLAHFTREVCQKQLVLDVLKTQEKMEKIREELKLAIERQEENLEAKRDRLEEKIDRYFDFVTEDVVLDSRAIVASVKRYKEELAEPDDLIKIGGGKKRVPNSLRVHLGALKAGKKTGDDHERLCFTDLTILDQNLLLRSFLSRSEIKDMEKQLQRVEQLEALLAHESIYFEGLVQKQKELDKKGHELLSGNHMLMKRYFEAREKVTAIQTMISEHEAVLRQSSWRRLMRSEIRKMFDIDLGKLPVNAALLVRAKKNFSREHFNAHSEEIERLKQEKPTKENKARLREIFDVRWARHKRIQELCPDNIKDELNLLVAHILDDGKDGSRLQAKYDAFEQAVEELKLAREERKQAALEVVGNYNSHAGKEADGVLIRDLISQLGCNFETICKHAGSRKTRHYFKSLNHEQTIGGTEAFASLLDLIASNRDKTEISAADLAQVLGKYMELTECLVQRQDQIKVKNVEKSSLHKEINSDNFNFRDFEEFKQERFPHFLRKIYKDTPEVVINRFMEGLRQSNDNEKYIEEVSANPALLGKLQATGFFASIFNNDNVTEIKANLSNFKENLERFAHEEDMADKLRVKLKSGKLLARIKELDSEIAALKAMLPNKAERRLIDDIGYLKDQGILDKTGAGIALANLFKGENASELLSEFGLEEYSKNDKALQKDILQESVKPARPKEARGKELGVKETKIRALRYDFREVRAALTRSDIERIFRDYAGGINPDSKLVRKGNSLVCGSLQMNLAKGLWHRFSDGSGGDIFSFVAQATGSSKKEALEIIAGKVGIGPRVESSIVSTHQSGQNIALTKNDIAKNAMSRDEWTVAKTVPDSKAISTVEFDGDLKWLLKDHGQAVSHIWHYRNSDGDLIGSTIRLVDHETGKKQVMPLAYCQNTLSKKSQWRIKGFDDNGYKAIYGAEKLAHSQKPVLIVEGEKTAEAAGGLFPEYTVISWLGGSGAVEKVNWRLLADKEVIVWPDNDLAGARAAKSILREINRVNGYSGFCSVVDTGGLNLPEKWDLADELPEGVTFEKIREAIAVCRNIEKTMADYEQEAEMFSTEEAKTFWQQSSIGFITSISAINELARENHNIASVLEGKELRGYINYAAAREKIDLGHEFLDFNDPLYRAMVGSAVTNFLQKYQGAASCKTVKDLFDRADDVVEIAKASLDIFEKAKNDINTCDLPLCEQFKKDNRGLEEINSDKAELYKELVKDFIFLHQEQLGVSGLGALHRERLSKDIAKVIKDYDLDYKGRQMKIDDEARKKIASIAYSCINSSSWWQGLVAGEMELKRAALVRKECLEQNYRQEFEFTIRLHQDKLDDVARLDLEFDAEKFKEELKNLPDKAREERIKAVWLDSFKDHIAPKLDHFDRLKKETKTVNEYLDVLRTELKEGVILYKAHKRLVEHGATVLNDNRIESLQFLHEDKPEFTEHLARDIGHGASHGLWTEKEALETLNTGKPLRFLTDSFFDKCRKYHLDCIDKDLKGLDRGISVEKDNQRFDSHKAYLEHHVNNEVLKPYLQNTIVTAKLNAIYKQEALQKQQELELQKERQLEKEYGKGGMEL